MLRWDVLQFVLPHVYVVMTSCAEFVAAEVVIKGGMGSHWTCASGVQEQSMLRKIPYTLYETGATAMQTRREIAHLSQQVASLQQAQKETAAAVEHLQLHMQACMTKLMLHMGCDLPESIASTSTNDAAAVSHAPAVLHTPAAVGKARSSRPNFSPLPVSPAAAFYVPEVCCNLLRSMCGKVTMHPFPCVDETSSCTGGACMSPQNDSTTVAIICCYLFGCRMSYQVKLPPARRHRRSLLWRHNTHLKGRC